MRIGHIIAAVAIGTGLAVIAAPAAPTAAGEPLREPFIRTIEPWFPDIVPTTPPVVELTAACVRLTPRGQLEAIFGYDNPTATSVFSPIEDDHNVILRERWPSSRDRPPEVETFGPQVTLFLPGAHPYAFAVGFRWLETVAWQVRVPSSDPDETAAWRVTVEPRLLTRCLSDVPRHFAVVQQAKVVVGPANIIGAEEGNITAYDLAMGLSEVRVACSAGGEHERTDVIAGWSPGDTNLAPLGPDDVLYVAPTAIGDFAMTRTTARAVLDVGQPVNWVGPIADVTGYCRFRDGVVASDMFWAGQPANGLVEPVIEDGAVVELGITLALPAGVRIR